MFERLPKNLCEQGFQAVKQSPFHPRMRNGAPVGGSAIIEVTFRLL